ncbi:hypothetical protein [Sapientia aquatica]|uniref:DUF3300 domain-containing protein n=1 Tax=Sapientia aquatica TaxID=1549640 RepID=A0A4R5W2Y4_9BURK|nr:hypothetical protein [Sapientia aquatica]TDK67063.1 hypothetical protein E2I14_04645 [Sapientia aquatica]
MKMKFLTIGLGAIVLTASASSYAQIGISFGVNTCGYPGLYQTCPYYDPPVGVYLGRGNWGGGREYHGHGDRGRGRGDDHGGRGRR